jgi:hypothetical protein
MGNQTRIIQRNWQHRVHRTKINKTKTQHYRCWTPLTRRQTQITQTRHAAKYVSRKLNILCIMLKIVAFFITSLFAQFFLWGLEIYSQVEKTCMTASFHQEGVFGFIRLDYICQFLLKYHCQANKARQYRDICVGRIHFLRFF